MHYFDSSCGASLRYPGRFLLSLLNSIAKKALMHARYHGIVFVSRILLCTQRFLGFEYLALHPPAFWLLACLLSHTTDWYIASPHNNECSETD